MDARDASVAAVVVGAVLLISPARHLWAFASAPWWTPVVLWLLLIALGVWIATLPSAKP